MHSAEIFVGAGGLGIGAGYAGFKNRFVLDSNKVVCETLRSNANMLVEPFRGWTVYNTDVRQFDFKAITGRVDLLLGGPPCQPFSRGGLTLAHDDGRDMFSEAVRAVRELRPLAFVFENVKGLARTRLRNYFQYICLQLKHPSLKKVSGEEDWISHWARLERHETSFGHSSELRYNVVSRVLNAADYGVPQYRERIFIVGFRCDIPGDWYFPQPTHSLDALLWSKWRAKDYWDFVKSRVVDDEFEIASSARLLDKPRQRAWVTARQALADLPNPSSTSSAKVHDHEYIPGARTYRGHSGSQLDAPSKTIKAGVHGVPGGENMIQLGCGQVRYLTIRECARLQTLPDEMRFAGTRSQKINQIGNAVPALLSEILLESIRAKLARLDVLHNSARYAPASASAKRSMRRAGERFREERPCSPRIAP